MTLDSATTEALLGRLGFALKQVCVTPEHFGSWYVVASGKAGHLRVVWDGRDGGLIIQRALAGDEWADFWVAGPGDGLDELAGALAALNPRPSSAPR